MTEGTKNRLLLAAGLLAGLAAVDVPLAIYAERTGANIRRFRSFEQRPAIWARDDKAGYWNKPNARIMTFGKVLTATDSHGFRSDYEVQPDKKGRLRVFFMGDSITWGIRVNREDTFLALLEKAARREGRDVEVVDAACIGYGSLQERIAFEERVLPFSPDVVFVNFCYNDLFPSENPFGNLRYIVSAYLRGYLASPPGPLNPSERGIIGRAAVDREFLGRIPGVLGVEDEAGAALFKPMVEAPLLEMRRLARAHKARLVFLFIPPTGPNPISKRFYDEAMGFMKANGIEYLDLTPVFHEDPSVYSGGGARESVGLMLEKMFDFDALAEVNPFFLVGRITALWAERRHHEERLFIDLEGHPSKKGHRLIARTLLDYCESRRLLERSP